MFLPAPSFLVAPSPRTLLMIWEVLAHTRTSPNRAVCLLSRQGVTVTAAEAARQLAAAPDRNTLRLVRFCSDGFQSGS